MVPDRRQASRISASISRSRRTADAPSRAPTEVYNLAADMGGMGFIETHRVDCLRSILINTHMVEAAWRAGAKRYFYSSSACAYNTDLQKDPHVRALKESDAYPGDGRARLRLGEARLRDVLPGVLGRARHGHLHRPLPQRLRPLRHLDGRPREGPRRHRAQGAGGDRVQERARSTSGATARRPAASCTSTTA